MTDETPKPGDDTEAHARHFHEPAEDVEAHSPRFAASDAPAEDVEAHAFEKPEKHVKPEA